MSILKMEHPIKVRPLLSNILIYLVLIVATIIILLPMFWMVSTSFSS